MPARAGAPVCSRAAGSWPTHQHPERHHEVDQRRSQQHRRRARQFGAEWACGPAASASAACCWCSFSAGRPASTSCRWWAAEMPVRLLRPSRAWRARRRTRHRRRREPSTWWTRSWRTPSRRGSRSSEAATSRRPRCCSGMPIQSGVRVRAVGDRAVLLPGGSQGLSRPRFLHRARRRRFGAPGDFARAYVIAHELGHHVQALMGTDDAGAPAQSAVPISRMPCPWRWSSRPTATPASGGTMPHRAAAARRVTIETGDVEAGLQAAAAIGDDRIQRMQTGARGARPLHARLVGAARDVVPPRARLRRPESLRYVQQVAAASFSAVVSRALRAATARRHDSATIAAHGRPLIGRSVPRREGRAKVTGQARYVDDFTLPGMLFGATVRSDVARGRILGIDFDPGFPGTSSPSSRPPTFPDANRVALILDDQPYLADDVVNHPEEPVVLLAHPRSLPAGGGAAPRHHADRSAAAGRVLDRGRARRQPRGLGRRQHLQVVHGGARRRGRGVGRRRARSSRANTRPARRSSSTSSRTACSRSQARDRASRCGARCSARTTSTTRSRRCSACRPKKFASSRWRPAAGSAARRSIRRSSPATRRCWRGSRAGR